MPLVFLYSLVVSFYALSPTLPHKVEISDTILVISLEAKSEAGENSKSSLNEKKIEKRIKSCVTL